jgi:hypothetical protein
MADGVPIVPRGAVGVDPEDLDRVAVDRAGTGDPEVTSLPASAADGDPVSGQQLGVGQRPGRWRRAALYVLDLDAVRGERAADRLEPRSGECEEKGGRSRPILLTPPRERQKAGSEEEPPSG